MGKERRGKRVREEREEQHRQGVLQREGGREAVEQQPTSRAATVAGFMGREKRREARAGRAVATAPPLVPYISQYKASGRPLASGSHKLIRMPAECRLI